jgi:pimeloyl-ACP methyl ester carboxylesterase
MSPRRRLGKKLFKSLLPVLALLALAVATCVGYIIYGITRPPRHPYIVTKQTFAQLSGPASKVTDETWRNRDGTPARAWLLRGAPGAPGIVLLHRYGTDRSWLFNLGVKLNEATNFTILWPDLRGHGLDPPVKWTSFGVQEGDDVLAAMDFLKSLKGPDGKQLVGEQIGLYGVELGGLSALEAAEHHTEVAALALDSVPRSRDELLQAAVKDDIGLNNGVIQYLVRNGMRLYFMGTYNNVNACEIAASLKDRRVLLLSGPEADYLKDSTASLTRCFPNSVNVESKTDLPLTGFKLPSATGEQGEAYDRRVIDFFDRTLRSTPQTPVQSNRDYRTDSVVSNHVNVGRF